MSLAFRTSEYEAWLRGQTKPMLRQIAKDLNIPYFGLGRASLLTAILTKRIALSIAPTPALFVEPEFLSAQMLGIEQGEIEMAMALVGVPPRAAMSLATGPFHEYLEVWYESQH